MWFCVYFQCNMLNIYWGKKMFSNETCTEKRNACFVFSTACKLYGFQEVNWILCVCFSISMECTGLSALFWHAFPFISTDNQEWIVTFKSDELYYEVWSFFRQAFSSVHSIV
jgi:hypothetical protein